MNMYPYLECLAAFGVADAHPGGFPITKMLIETHTDSFTGKKILDAGCGTGRTAEYLADHFSGSVTAVDAHPMMIKKAKARLPQENSDVTILQADVTALPFADASFDTVLSESVVIFTNGAAALREFNRVLKPGGKVFLNEMTAEEAVPEHLLEKMNSLYGIVGVPSAGQWIEQLEYAGFNKIQKAKPDPSGYDDVKEFIPDPDISNGHFKTLDEHEEILALTKHAIGWNIYVGTKR